MPAINASGSHPDWSKVEWFVYDDPVRVNNGEQARRNYRVSPRELSPGECRVGERLIATVKRCSLKTVRTRLKLMHPAVIQAFVDHDAGQQVARNARDAAKPNTYRELLDRWKAKGATAKAA